MGIVRKYVLILIVFLMIFATQTFSVQVPDACEALRIASTLPPEEPISWEINGLMFEESAGMIFMAWQLNPIDLSIVGGQDTFVCDNIIQAGLEEEGVIPTDIPADTDSLEATTVTLPTPITTVSQPDAEDAIVPGIDVPSTEHSEPLPSPTPPQAKLKPAKHILRPHRADFDNAPPPYPTPTKPFCGDGKVNQPKERCDPPDNRLCPERCRPSGTPQECTCLTEGPIQSGLGGLPPIEPKISQQPEIVSDAEEPIILPEGPSEIVPIEPECTNDEKCGLDFVCKEGKCIALDEPTVLKKIGLWFGKVFGFEEDIIAITEPIVSTTPATPTLVPPLLPSVPQDITLLPEILPPEPKLFGHIIQFLDPPVVVEENRLRELGLSEHEVKVRSQDYRRGIAATQEIAISDIKVILNTFGLVMDDLQFKKFENVFNGITLELVPDEVIREIESLSYVKELHPDGEVQGFLGGSVPLIDADDVWNLADASGKNITGQNIIIAIIDTGIDYTHADLGNCTNTTFLAGNCAKVIGGFDFVNNDADPMDDHGHGTHVAATAAGNGVLKGVAPDVKLVGYKVLDQRASGSFSDIIASINLAVDPNQDGNTSDHYDIISMSLGGSGNPDDATSQAVDNAVLAGVVAVIAAANSGPSYQTIGSPGVARKAITVGGSDKSDGLYYYSSRGPTSVGAIKPDIVAPGVSICAARYDNAWPGSECVDNQHVAISGTSMATPHVAGLVALLKQKYPSWTAEEMKMALKNTAINLGYDYRTQGWGRVDALAAVQLNVAPCVAEFNTYGFTGAVNGTFNIKGRGTCAVGFSNYTVSFGVGEEPASFTMIGTSNLSVNSGILANWNTSVIQDGAYTVQLLVSDNGGRVSEDRFIVQVINNLTTCFSCGDCDAKVDFAGAKVTLANDITSTGNTCISIGTDDVTLDCAGHRLTGSQTGAGIYISKSRATVKSCVVVNFTYGIYMDFSTNNNLMNNDMFGNSRFNLIVWGLANQYNHSIDTSNKVSNKSLYYYFNINNQVIENLDTAHITVAGSSNVTIRNNVVSNGDSIRLALTNDSTVINNVALNSRVGIWLDPFSNNNRIINNTINNTSGDRVGIWVVNSQNNTILNNILLNNHFAGIYLLSSDNSAIRGNTVLNGFWQGIIVFRSRNTNVTNNIASGQGGAGVEIQLASDNSVTNNVFTNNRWGIRLYGTVPFPSSSNTIMQNEISTNTDGIKFESPATIPFVGVNNIISFNNIYNNALNFNNVQINNLTATNNWWGMTLCSSIDSGIFDGKNVSSLGRVTFNPILNNRWPGGIRVNCTLFPGVPTAPTPLVAPNPEIICNDNIDNDGDSAVDCADSDCQFSTVCRTLPTAPTPTAPTYTQPTAPTPPTAGTPTAPTPPTAGTPTAPTSPTSPTGPVSPSCRNGVKDAGETDVDCGGSTTCQACAKGKSCNVNSDCMAGTTCVNNVCT